MAYHSQLCTVLCGLFCLQLTLSFNLDPRIPIVKRGRATSHFGYSVAQHQSVNFNETSGENVTKSWILVGAPKDQNLQPGTNNSGALWKCPLTSYDSDCIQVHTDGYKNVDETLSPPRDDEIKDDQWMGVTVKSQGTRGKVLVCAHRYMHKGAGFQWGFGLCYILTQNLDVDNFMEPCRGRPVERGHQQWGVCQAGTSGLLLDDEALLGVPGPFTWRGTVHTSNISDNYLFRDKTQYFGPVSENDYPVDKYSYLGYSVTAGRYFGNHMSYVGGAPRSNGTGQVVFFNRVKVGESLLNVELILAGEMFASSFGFELCGLDINKDGMDDLVVGAPFYYTKHSSGAIYVYINKEGGLTRDHKFMKIEGAAGESRFGFSITSLGDLNHDGYNDIAVGAPYEDRGAIYIFLGTQHGLKKEPAQIIRAQDIPGVTYNAFGYALSGGIDMDGNGYPDLLTSSFCSDRVLLIRARPIIDIHTEVRAIRGDLNNIDPTKISCADDIKSLEPCFAFDACFKMDNDVGTNERLSLKYAIEENLYKDHPIRRVRFGGVSNNVTGGVVRNIQLLPEKMGFFQCNREVVYLKEGIDVLKPLRFKLSYEIIQLEPQPLYDTDELPNIDRYPILNQQEALRYFEGKFAKDCGDDDECKSDLHIDATLELDKHETKGLYILQLGDRNSVAMNVEVINTGEPAYQSSLIIHHHKALLYEETENYHCRPAISENMVICDIGNPLTKTTGKLELIFKYSGQDFNDRFIEFKVDANTSSTELTPQSPIIFRAEVIKKAEISIHGFTEREQVYYGGEVKGESEMEVMEDIGSKVVHKYIVDNRGPWHVKELKVEVFWPHQVENNKDQGKWLLYMTETPFVEGDGECEVDPSLVNPLILRRQRHHISGPAAEIVGGLPEVDNELDTSGPARPDIGAGSGGTYVHGSGGTAVITEKKTTKITETVETKTSKVSKVSTATARTSSSSGTSSVSSSSSSSGSSSISSSSSGGSSSSSGGSSSSDSSVSTSHRGTYSASSGGYGSSETLSGSGDQYYEEGVADIEGSGELRQRGRGNARVSRRVFKQSEKRKYSEGSTSVNDFDKDGEDGHIDSTYYKKESITSTKTNPDGSVVRSHHESETGDKPTHTLWGEGGGHREGHHQRVHDFNKDGEDGQIDSTYYRKESVTSTKTNPDGSVIRSHHESETGEKPTHLQWGEGGGHRRGHHHREHDGTHRSHSTHRIHSNHSTSSSAHGERRQGGGSTGDYSLTGYDDGYQGSGLDDRGKDYERRTEESYRKVYTADFSNRDNTHEQETTGRSSIGYDNREYGRNDGYGHGDRDNTHVQETSGRSSIGYDSRGYDQNEGDGHGDFSGRRGHVQSYDDRRTRVETYDTTGRTSYDQYGPDGENYGQTDGDLRQTDGYRKYSSSSSSSSSNNRGGTFRGGDDSNDRRAHTGHNDNWVTQDSWGSHNSGGNADWNYDDENGTWTRIEIDPKTGDSTIYTKKTSSGNSADGDNWRKYESSSSSSSSRSWSSDGSHTRSRRELRRIKREKEMVIKPMAITDAQTGKTMQVINMRCDEIPTAKCFRFTCNIRNLEANQSASIRIKSRLWNATLVEDYPGVSYVSIKSNAGLLLPDDIKRNQDQSDDVSEAETLAYPDRLETLPAESIPLWVIIVSILAGILLLIIIALILWKLGFFERKRPDPTLSGNLDKDANGY